MKQNHLMKHNLAGFILMAALSLVFIAASGSIYQLLRGPVTVNQPEFPLKDGQYSYDLSLIHILFEVLLIILLWLLSRFRSRTVPTP